MKTDAILSADLREGGSGEPIRILVADADCALFGLLEAWLAGCGCTLAGACGVDEAASDRYDLILADIPFPRQDAGMVKALQHEYPGTPIVALSSSFLPGVEASGSVARELGVASVLAKPVTREALVTALRQAVKTAR
jgi:CheY-like chemotaxis protein